MGTDWPVLCLFRALPLASGEQGLGGREGVLEQSSVEEGDAKAHTCGQSAVNRRPEALQAALERGWGSGAGLGPGQTSG